PLRTPGLRAVFFGDSLCLFFLARGGLMDKNKHLMREGNDAIATVLASRTHTEPNSHGTERPKYPPPPRSGNAFAAAVFAAIPGMLILIVLAWVFAQDR